MLLRAGAKHLYIPGGILGVRACSAGEIGGAGGVTSTRSVSFNGASCIDFGDLSVADVGTANFTISLWVKGGGTSQFVFVKDTSSSVGKGLYLYTDSSSRYAWYPEATPIVIGAIDGNWHHIAVVRNGTGSGQVSVYYDGLETATGTDSRNLTNTHPLRIGRSADDIGGFTGLVDDPRIYNTTLTPTDVANLYAGQDVTTGLVAYWALEEGSGTNAVDSIGGNNGTLTNGPTWHPQPPAQLVPNRITSTAGVVFDGTNDFIEFTTSATPLSLTDNFSLSVWIKPNGTLLAKGVFGKTDTSDNGYVLGFDGAGYLRFPKWNSGARSDAVPTSDQWIHVAAVQDNGTNKLYVNGVLQATTGVLSVPGTTSYNLVIGRIYPTFNAFYFNGLIDDPRIYSRALSATEIAQLCRGQNPATNDPVGWWKLDEGSGTTAADSGSGGNNGTLTNGPTWIRTNGVQFDGSNDYISLGDVVPPATDYTFSIWANATALGHQILFAKDRDTGAQFRCALSESGSGRILFYGPNAPYPLETSVGVTTNTWFHVVVVRTGTTFKIYLDGTERASGSGTVGASNSGLDFRLGARIAVDGTSVSLPLSGKLDDFRIYNVALSPAEVAALYAGTNPSYTPVGWWKLNEQHGTIARDSGSGGNNGTLTNGPTWAGVAPWLRP